MPGGQIEQAPSEVAPATLLKVPAGQEAQAMGEDAEEKVPAGQARHDAAEVAPTTVAYVPTRQEVQAAGDEAASRAE